MKGTKYIEVSLRVRFYFLIYSCKFSVYLPKYAVNGQVLCNACFSFYQRIN